MLFILILFLLLVIFALAAMRWGFDSRDTLQRTERQARHAGIV
jgi:hypothetical protein